MGEAELQPQEVVVRRLGRDGKELAVFEFQGKMRDLVLERFRESYLATGSYAHNSRAVSPQNAAAVAVAGSASALGGASAALSSTVYLATASPSTLMSIGAGVGSAVMGPTGIVAQAPFIPVPIALPLLMPMMALQVMSTSVIMREFKRVDQKLDAVKASLDRAIARIEATHVGELLAASRVVDEVYLQYDADGRFSTDMLTRLAIAERDVRALAMRYRQFVEKRDTTDVQDLDDVKRSNYDAHAAMLASFMELRVAYLRVCVDMQENPRSVEASVDRLKHRIDDGIEFWQTLQDRSLVLKEEIRELEMKLQAMNWAERNIGGRGSQLDKDLARRRAAYTSTMESEREIMEDFHALIRAARETRAALDAPETGDSATLVYWNDEAGEHAFVTDEDIITG